MNTGSKVGNQVEVRRASMALDVRRKRCRVFIILTNGWHCCPEASPIDSDLQFHNYKSDCKDFCV